MDIAIASDFHGQWFELELIPADILILAGDILDYYAADQVVNAREQLFELEQLNLFLGHHAAKYKEIIIVAGNHDFAFQYFPDAARKKLTNAVYLQDESYSFGGYKIYGSPWQPYFGGWAFNFLDHNSNFFEARDQAIACWDKIPKDVNILVTHTPPLHVLDSNYKGINCGCQYLAERLQSLDKLLLHAFGHIHAGRGTSIKDGLLSVNASNSLRHDRVDFPLMHVNIDENDVASVGSLSQD